MKPSDDTATEYLSVLVANAFDAMNAELVRRLHQRGFGHVKSSFRLVFRELGNGDAVSVSALARVFDVTTQAVSQLLRDMESHELVHRMPDLADRRVSVVQLTAKGRRTYKTVQAIHAQFEAEWIGLLGAGAAKQLRLALETLGRSAHI
jgi:DNA-binding MarR family transcriptional regulator